VLARYEGGVGPGLGGRLGLVPRLVFGLGGPAECGRPSLHPPVKGAEEFEHPFSVLEHDLVEAPAYFLHLILGDNTELEQLLCMLPSDLPL